MRLCYEEINSQAIKKISNKHYELFRTYQSRAAELEHDKVIANLKKKYVGKAFVVDYGGEYVYYYFITHVDKMSDCDLYRIYGECVQDDAESNNFEYRKISQVFESDLENAQELGVEGYLEVRNSVIRKIEGYLEVRNSVIRKINECKINV